MDERAITIAGLRSFYRNLIQEKNTATVEKYFRDVRTFADCVGENKVTEELVLAHI